MRAFNQQNTTQRARLLGLILKELGYSDIRDFQSKNNLVVDGWFGINSYRVLYQIYLRPININFESHYHRWAIDKNQLVLHHGACRDVQGSMFEVWKIDGLRHVATAVAIGENGRLERGFDENFWAVHIGAYDVGLPNFTALETQSIGVEIYNWGALEHRNGQFWTWIGDYGKRGRGETLPQNRVIKLDYKGIEYFEVYSDAEIETTRRWIMLNAIRFNIPLSYNAKDFWEVSPNATAGKAGLYTHNSYISWKSDISPQPKMIAMLEQFNRI